MEFRTVEGVSNSDRDWGRAPFMLVTSFRSRMPAKFSLPKTLILIGSVLSTQKSHASSFTPWNFPRAPLSFTGPRASTGKKCHCRPGNFNNTVIVPMLFLCCNAEYRIWSAGCCNGKCLLCSLFSWSEHRQATWIVRTVGNWTLRGAQLHSSS